MTADASGSLQDRYAPASSCFGCGPANDAGLRVRSFERDDGKVVASWSPRPEHEAFPNVLSGGVIGTLLDCHSNWTAALALMRARGRTEPETTVTAAFDVRLTSPTPTDAPLEIEAHVVKVEGERAVVLSSLVADGRVTATCRATHVIAPQGHPAYGAWNASANDSSAAETSSGA